MYQFHNDPFNKYQLTCYDMAACHRRFGASKHTVYIKFVEEATEYEAKILHEHEVTDLEIIRGCTGTNQCLFIGLYLHKTDCCYFGAWGVSWKNKFTARKLVPRELKRCLYKHWTRW